VTTRSFFHSVRSWLSHRWDDFSSRENSFNLLMAMLIGLIGGLGAVGFRKLIHAVELLFFQSTDPTVQVLSSLPWWLILGIPVLGGLLVGPLVSRVAAEAKGHGVPQVMLSVARKGGLIRGKVAAAKVVASALTIGSGGSAGSEGPIVQIGAALASWLGQKLHVSPRRMKTFVGCGAAAGIAATFNAPVAGMIFAVEVILGDFGVAKLSPIIVASVMATAVSRSHFGDVAAFAVPPYEMVSAWELIPYALLGAAAAFVAVLFILSLHRAEGFFEELAVPDWLKPAIGGLGIGLMGLAGLTHVYGVGYEFIEEALHGHLGLGLLLALIFAKILATSLTLGSGGSGGILAPSLFLGAMLGGVVWYGASAISPLHTAPHYGAYSLVGMAAVLAAATRAPLQAILILFELTGGYQVILPLMLSSIIAVMLAGRLMKESIYTIKLKAQGIDLEQGQDRNVLSTVNVGEVMRSDMKTVPSSLRVSLLLQELSDSSQHPTFFVLNDEGKLAGIIGYPEIRRVLFDVETLAPVLRAEDICTGRMAPITPEDSLDLVIREFSRMNADELPVVDPRDTRRIIGSVHRTDVVDAYHAQITKLDLLEGATQSLSATERLGTAAFGAGLIMAEVELPSHFAGKNLAELALRQSHGIEILLIKRHVEDQDGGRIEQLMPAAELILHNGDRLLVSGPREKVEGLH
jgi:CIC family chloride channel protein